mmetsp:Transcript_25222/g.50180  ORF Transcript_25222/g.50180 Transcript_25222/m.50180 type:complete len:220 (+) Transcript_25222:286-945(+)
MTHRFAGRWGGVGSPLRRTRGKYLRRPPELDYIVTNPEDSTAATTRRKNTRNTCGGASCGNAYETACSGDAASAETTTTMTALRGLDRGVRLRRGSRLLLPWPGGWRNNRGSRFAGGKGTVPPIRRPLHPTPSLDRTARSSVSSPSVEGPPGSPGLPGRARLPPRLSPLAQRWRGGSVRTNRGGPSTGISGTPAPPNVRMEWSESTDTSGATQRTDGGR